MYCNTFTIGIYLTTDIALGYSNQRIANISANGYCSILGSLNS